MIYRMSPEILELINAARMLLATHPDLNPDAKREDKQAALAKLSAALEPFGGSNIKHPEALREP